MLNEARERFPEAECEAITTKHFFDSKDEDRRNNLCELDAGVIIHHPNGEVECWLGEHNATLSLEGGRRHRKLRRTIQCGLIRFCCFHVLKLATDRMPFCGTFT